MYDTHSPAEWAQMGSLAIGLYGSASAVYFLLVDADLADFDPRPLVRRALGSDAGARLVVAVFNAKCDVREFAADAHVYARLSLREAALTGAALFTLLTTTPEHTR